VKIPIVPFLFPTGMPAPLHFLRSGKDCRVKWYSSLSSGNSDKVAAIDEQAVAGGGSCFTAEALPVFRMKNNCGFCILFKELLAR
jgi:hypothetical protein